MTIEATLERIAVALERLAAVPTTGGDVVVQPKKAPKPTTAKAVVDAEPVLAPAALPATTAPAPGAAQPAAQNAAAATPAKAPTLDDVRNALVQCQTRKGTKEVPMTILAKYSPTKTTGGLKKEDFSKVIAECAAA